MPSDDRTKRIYGRTPKSAAILAKVKRAMAITAILNRLTFNDADEIRVGHNVFVNQNCTFHDLGGLDIADDVMIGPNVSTSRRGTPLNPRSDAPPQSEYPS
jgi:acetyltransferase-like isoleucine patch superfamily enzyme